MKTQKIQKLLQYNIFSDIRELIGLREELNFMRKRISFKNKSILDVGCGTGKFLILCSLFCDPKKSVGLDQAEGKGSKKEILEKFKNSIKILNIDNIGIIKNDIFDFHTDQKFNIITLNFSLHHIIRTKNNLCKDPDSQQKTLRLFQKIFCLLEDDGILIIKEVSNQNLSRYINFYGKLLGLNLDWETKHQPYEYKQILRLAKFQDIKISYGIPFIMKKYGLDKFEFLFSNKIANFFLSSTYFIIAKKHP